MILCLSIFFANLLEMDFPSLAPLEIQFCMEIEWDTRINGLAIVRMPFEGLAMQTLYVIHNYF